MVSSDACPGDDAFVRLLEGRLPATERDRIIEHVHICSRCSLFLATPERPASRPHSAGAGALLVTSFEPDAVLAGRYCIRRLLGAGGMGEVYEALDLSLAEPLALKTVRATAADDPRAMERLKSEVLLARRVTHPNVCRIFDFGVHGLDGTHDPPLPFLTMELLTGVTLDARLRSRGPVARGEVLEIAQQLVAGLQAAHRVSVIHKDLKAENVILIEQAGGTRAVITDFGLAAIPALVNIACDAAPRFSGTPGYVAPERLAGAPVTEANDVYALGVVMLDMLSGALPHEREKGRGIGPAASETEPLLAIARRCQAVDPAERPTLGDVQLALERLERPPVKVKSRRARAALPMLSVVVLAASLGLARWRATPPPRAPVAAPVAASSVAAPTGAAAEGALETLPPVSDPQPKPEPKPTALSARPRLPTRPPAAARRRTVAPLSEDLWAADLLLDAEERLGSGRIADACALGQVAARHASRTPAVWEFLGRCYMRLPDPDAARLYYRNYLTIAPDGPKAALIRAMVGSAAP
jgi:serine/threonine protein kinase